MINDTTTGTDSDRLLATLRPHTLTDFIGQDQIKASLNLSLKAAAMRGKVLDHVLLNGPPGLGKTTLAQIIANEMGGPLVTIIGPSLQLPGDLIGVLVGLKAGSILFIDEIHALPREIEEVLYPAMEDFRVDFVSGEGMDATAQTIALKPFTLIGATTRKGDLSKPLLDRFGLEFALSFYDLTAMTRITQRSAGLLDLPMEDAACELLAQRSRGTPRIANRLLRRVDDYALVANTASVDAAMVEATMQVIGIDASGMDATDRRYLTTLLNVYNGGPVGIGSLAATMQVDEASLIDVIEPYMMINGLVARTPRGRSLTMTGMNVARELETKGQTCQQNFPL